MIDTSSWKEFPLTALFDIKGSTTTPKNNLNLSFDGKYPYITTAATNNGIAGYSDKYTEDGKVITIDSAVLGTAFYQEDNFTASDHVEKLIPKFEINELIGQYLASVLNASARFYQYAYNDKRSQTALKNEIIKLPATPDGQPDWDYMESYMKAVMEESEKSLESLRKADDAKHLIDVSGWGEFKLSNLFTKKTMKGYPKKAESYEEVENGYHIYGQNIGWQYPYKVLMDEQYLHKVEPDKPILAYTSSVGEIGLINESFYRSGDNGAFQGLFPIGYHPNLLQMQFVLSILKKEFEAFRYDTSMQNTMDITFKIPITSTGEPDWQYMEDYMRRIMDKSEQIISDLQIGA